MIEPTGTIIAGLIVAVVAATYASNASEGFPVISTTTLLLAGVIWLAGWVCSHVCAGR